MFSVGQAAPYHTLLCHQLHLTAALEPEALHDALPMPTGLLCYAMLCSPYMLTA
jgi:hypothetical protein